jgi:hypothetical protein
MLSTKRGALTVSLPAVNATSPALKPSFPLFLDNSPKKRASLVPGDCVRTVLPCWPCALHAPEWYLMMSLLRRDSQALGGNGPTRTTRQRGASQIQAAVQGDANCAVSCLTKPRLSCIYMSVGVNDKYVYHSAWYIVQMCVDVLGLCVFSRCLASI